jgi:F-type H+-transporting ATPase subunit b
MINLDTTIGSLLEAPVGAEALNSVEMVHAAGGPVSLDITAAISLGVFLLTWFLLHNLLFKHYLKVREKREQGIGGNKVEAEEMRATAEAKLATYEQGLAQARAEATELRATMKTEAVSQEDALLNAAQAEANQVLAKNRATIEDQVKQARGQLKQEAQRLSELMADQLLPSA